MGRIRRNRIDERSAAFVWAVATVSGIAACTAGASPSGSTVVDVVWVFASAAFVTWASASASWWMLLVGAAAAGVFSSNGWWLLVSVAATVLAGLIGWRKWNEPGLRALVGLAVVQVVFRFDLEAFFGASTLAALTVLGPLVVVGVVRRPRDVRRRVWIGSGVLVGFVALAAMGLSVGALQSQEPLRDGADAAQAGLEKVRDSVTDGVVEDMELAAAEMERAAAAVDRPWARLADLVPVLAQHRTAVADLASSAGATATEIGSSVGVVQVDALRPTGGVVDLTQLEVIRLALERTDVAVQELDATIEEVSSPWLLAPLQDRIDDVGADVDDAVERVGDARAVADVAPALLGADGPRNYFVAFTSPAEARGHGFLGNFAELRTDGGRIELTRFGRNEDLIDGGADPTRRYVSAPDDYLETWGRFGLGSPDAPARPFAWVNLTASPQFSSVGEAMASLYPQSGGTPVDGVLLVGLDGLLALADLTGPLEVPGVGPLEGDALREFLLVGQYAIDDDTRVDLLEQLARDTTDGLLSGDLPGPAALARTLGPAMRAGGFALWTQDPEANDVIAGLGGAGNLPSLDGNDGLAVVTNNTSGNKLDAYLQREIEYRPTVDLATGVLQGELVVRLTNSAPASGLPEGVVGNLVGAPVATNVTALSIYTPHRLESVTVDGAPVDVGSGTEAGWNWFRTTVSIPAGGTVELRADVRGEVVAPYRLRLHPQQLANADQVTVEASTSSGTTAASFRGLLVQPLVLPRVPSPG